MFRLNHISVWMCRFLPKPRASCRNGQACGKHLAGSTEPAAWWCGSCQHPTDPAGATHHSPANARGLHAGWAARPHAVVPATAHRQLMRAQDTRWGQTNTKVLLQEHLDTRVHMEFLWADLCMCVPQLTVLKYSHIHSCSGQVCGSDAFFDQWT